MPFSNVWQRATWVNAQDPLRRALNGGFAKILVVWWASLGVLVAVEIIIHQPLHFVIFAFCTWLLSAGAWWLNRQGMVIGTLIYAGFTSLALTILTDPQSYAGSQPSVQLAFIGAIVITTLFVSPRLGWIVAILQLLLLVMNAAVAGVSWSTIIPFALFAGVMFFGITALMMVATGTFTRALRDSHHANEELALLNAELEQRVAERTADLQLANQRTQVANDQLQAANRELERRAHQRAKDTSELVHDATGLLGVVNSGVSMLVYTLPDDIRSQIEQEATTQLHPTITLLHSMLSSTLDAAQLEAHTLRIDDSKPVDLRSVAGKVEDMLTAFFHERRITYIGTMDPALPAVRGDEIRLVRVLLNLLLNAVKFTAPYHADHTNNGEGKVELQISTQMPWVILRVMDNGPGVPRAVLPTLAQRFSRAVQGNSAPQGTGIGLHAVTGMVGLHGGMMTIDSPGEGQGFIVTIHLPISTTHQMSS